MSLRWRIALVIVAFVSAASVVLLVLFNIEVRDDHAQDHVRWAQTLTSALAKSVFRDTLERKHQDVRETLLRVAKTSRDIEYILAVGFNGQVSASTFDDEIAPELLDIDHRHCRMNSVRRVKVGASWVRDTVFPLAQNLDAHIHLGVNDEVFSHSVTKATWTTALAGGVICILAIFFGALTARRITQPVHQLAEMVAAFGRGERIDFGRIHGGGPEVRTLTERFSAMVRGREDTEKTLRQFKTTLDQTQDCVFMFHADNLIFFYVNRGALEQVGYTREELLAMKPFDIKPDFDETRFRAMIAPMLAGEVTFFNFETRHRHKDGHDVPVEIALQYVAPDGEAPRFVAIVRDISERKQVEAALRGMNQSLEERVAARTAELMGAKDEAERANQAKSEFLSRMSHELRTPLNAILGFAQVLEFDSETPLHPEQQDSVREILRGGRHLLELINEVLDLARIEAGRLMLSLETVELAPVIRESVSLLQPVADARRIRLSVDTTGLDGLCVHADALRLKQVLLNLLSNGIKYNHDDGEVRLSLQAVAHGRVRVAVTDTGAGLTPAQQAKLFVPFERLDADRSAIEGTGIGLALAKRLVEAMAGGIGVECEAGEGCVFWFELPMVAAPCCFESREPDAVGSESESVASSVFKILYVEDNPANMRLMERVVMRRADLSLITASMPLMGLELAEAHLPDLIVLDIHLPGMDGFELLRRMRAVPALRETPILALSADALPREIARARDAGFSDYFTKPLDIRRFWETIDRLKNALATTE